MKNNYSTTACSSVLETVWALGVSGASGLALLS